MRVLFHANQMGLRGTEIALYDYAHFNEVILGNRSFVVYPREGSNVPEVVEKFKARFETTPYADPAELAEIAARNQVDAVYFIRAGQASSLLVPGVKNCVHAVFKFFEPHGDVYAYVSEWLSREMTGGTAPFVPHMVQVADDGADLRGELGIPRDAVVFGRYGGNDTFDVEFARRIVYDVARSHPDRYFLFMNTDDFLAERVYFARAKINKAVTTFLYQRRSFPNVVFLPGTSDAVRKRRFINSCDAMLHARRQGESFGLACGEFSICQKPVITCNADFVSDRNHIHVLKDRGLYYRNPSELRRILTGFHPDPSRDWDAFSAEHSPEPVMKKFQSVFLDGK